MTLPVKPSLFAPLAFLPEGWRENVRIRIDEDGKILQVKTDTTPCPQDLHLHHRVLLPAPANLHSHAFQRGLAGLTETRGRQSDSFWTWRQKLYRFAQLLNPEDVENLTALAYMEMMEAGYASVAEFHYLHHRPSGKPYDLPEELSLRVCAAAGQVGIGLTLLPVLYSYASLNQDPPHPAQRRFINQRDSFQKLMENCTAHLPLLPPDTVLGVAPHSLRTVATEDIISFISSLNCPIHIHVAEQQQEVKEVKHTLKTSPVQWLLDHTSLDKRWCLIHCTHATKSEVTQLAKRNCVVGLCPVTEANLGDGIFNASDYCQNGGILGVGTDSQVSISFTEEVKMLEYAQRLQTQRRCVLASPQTPSCGRFLFEAVLTGGGQALARKTGRIQQHFWADLLTLKPLSSYNNPHTLLDQWVFTAQLPVQEVLSAGRLCVKNGQHIKRQEILHRLHTTFKKIL